MQLLLLNRILALCSRTVAIMSEKFLMTTRLGKDGGYVVSCSANIKSNYIGKALDVDSL